MEVGGWGKVEVEMGSKKISGSRKKCTVVESRKADGNKGADEIE